MISWTVIESMIPLVYISDDKSLSSTIENELANACMGRMEYTTPSPSASEARSSVVKSTGHPAAGSHCSASSMLPSPLATLKLGLCSLYRYVMVTSTLAHSGSVVSVTPGGHPCNDEN